MSSQLAEPTYVDDLGNGLIRRWSTAADLPKIAERMGSIYRAAPDRPVSPRAHDLARVLMSGEFPMMGPGDFALVEDVSIPERPIVAYTCLWRLQWRIGEIRFGVGQPEMVATDPAYRNRGLVRSLFDMIHARSSAEGHLVQAITGIPYFYRQFGYEYVLDLEGSRILPVAVIPENQSNNPEPYRLRLATLDDVPQVMALYEQACSDSLVCNVANETIWRYYITAWNDPVARSGPLQTILHRRLYTIIDDDEKLVGAVQVAAKRWSEKLDVQMLFGDRRVNWQKAAPCLMRALYEIGKQTPATEENDKPFNTIEFTLGRTHPLYTVIDNNIMLRSVPPYAWYLRVPDAPAFLRHIAPLLEARLERSILIGYTGDVKIDFYRGGLHLAFKRGALTAVEPWRAPDYGDEADAGCPPLVFLQLLFGYRSLAELRDFFPDVWASAGSALLLDILFPKLPSTVHSLTNV
jgi:hypothetical protein